MQDDPVSVMARAISTSIFPSTSPRSHAKAALAALETAGWRVVPVDLVADAEALVDRMEEWSNEWLTNEGVRDWFGHVEPPKDRVRSALRTLASAPKHGGDDGEG